jgi:hypothetical protein
MPVPKSRQKQASLVTEVAQFLQIDTSVVFLDAVPMSEGRESAERRRKNRKNTLRIWTGNMDGDEKDRIRALKDEVKVMAARVDTKIALSDRHPLGDDGQAAFEERRRAQRAKKWSARNPDKVIAHPIRKP